MMLGDVLHMNVPRLLDHLDIEFSPVFGEKEIPESLATSTVPLSVTAPCIYASKDGKCKYSDDGKYEPDIEELMWRNCTKNGVDVAGSDTLLENDAYMFCHHGQGILYIEDSGQHLPGVGFELQTGEGYLQNSAVLREVEVRAITLIVRHHPVTEQTARAIDIHNNHENFLRYGVGPYHEYIEQDGNVERIHPPEHIAYGAIGNNYHTYHISVIGTGPIDAGESVLQGKEVPLDHELVEEFDPRQEAAFIERIGELIGPGGLLRHLTIDDVKGHYEVPGHGANSCPGIMMNPVRDRIRARFGNASWLFEELE